MPENQEPQNRSENQSQPYKAANKSQGSKNKSKNLGLLIIAIPVIYIVLNMLFIDRAILIDWHEDYQKAVDRARDTNKPLLINFDKKGAVWCDKMKFNVYNDKTVKKFVESEFVPVIIDIDANAELAEKYNISEPYPYFVIKYPDNENREAVIGYKEPGTFMGLLKTAKETLSQNR